jgi:site-specific DNA recombinase
MALYGGMSKGERNRIKIRVRSAMKAQTEFETLPRRPPALRLPPRRRRPAPQPRQSGSRHTATPARTRSDHRADRATNLHRVRRRARHDLNRPRADQRRHRLPLGIRPQAQPTPAQRGLGDHRSAGHLAQPALHRPAVWNKQRTDEVLIDVEDISLGHENKHRWNNPTHWVWSTTVVHIPLISTEPFEKAQSNIKTRGTHSEAGRARRSTTRPYLFRGLLRCGLCGR